MRRQSDNKLENLFFDPDLSPDQKAMFESFGPHSRIAAPFEAMFPQYISIGDYVSINRDMKINLFTDLTRQMEYIRQYCPEYLDSVKEEDYHHNAPRLVIRDRTSFGRSCFITVASSVTIGAAVIFSDRVYISDTQHRYDSPHIPILYQGVTKGGHAEIGDHSWIGIGACIINCTIGRHCVIGANSVVTADIPSYTVAAGVPAKPIKRFDFDAGEWKRINED